MAGLSLSDLKEFLGDNMRPKEEYDEISGRAVNDKALFATLWTLVKEGKQPIAWRAAWLLDHATENNPELIDPILDEIYSIIPGETHDGNLRHLMKFLLRRPLQLEKAGALVDPCIEWVMNPKETVSKRVLGLQLLYELYLLEPDFGNELRAIIEECEDRDGTRGFFNRLNKMKRLVYGV